jgi:hypothetical protein
VGGNIYAQREFDMFLSALDLGGWSLHGRPVRLRWLGPGRTVSSARPRMIEFLGWRPFQEALELASDCDLGYVSYWFDAKRALESECCFPSKMISYMGVGLPPFFHGPANAGPALFLRKFNTGYICSEQSPEAVLRDLTAALADPVEHAARGRRCLELAMTEFSSQTFSMRLRHLLQEMVKPQEPRATQMQPLASSEANAAKSPANDSGDRKAG